MSNPKQAKRPYTIGFLVTNTDMSFYQMLFSVMKQLCEAHGVRLVIFEGQALNTPDLNMRCYNSIYKIVSDHRIDALLVASSDLSAHIGTEGLKAFLENYPLPTVTIGQKVHGIPAITADDSTSTSLVMAHLAEHGYKNIVWVSGPAKESHAQQRLSVFLETITQMNPDFSEKSDVFYGDYTSRSGYETMALLHFRIGSDLDAICFANDEMAIGALEYCSEYGIHVPEDIAITGIDNIVLAQMVNPGLTTVSQNLQGMVDAAISYLVARIEGMDEPYTTNEATPVLHEIFSPQLFIRSSCGCEFNEPPRHNAFLKTIKTGSQTIGEAIQTFDSGELFEHLEAFWQDKNVSFCFVVAYEDLPENMACHNFEPPVFSRLLHGFINGRHVMHEPAFQTAQLLPDNLWDMMNGRNATMKALFFQNEAFGYIVASAEDRDRTYINDLRLMVSVTLKGEKLINERKQAQSRLEWALDAMRSVNTRLSDISLRDELTGLYNRRGFIQESTRHLHSNPESFLLGFIDMNELKPINDTLGHDEGDIAIRAVSEILRQSFRDHDILARVGGDEFAVLVKDVGEEQVARLERRFNEKCEKMSDELHKPYRLSFARGYVVGNASSDLEALMAEADEKMYKNKQEMKELKKKLKLERHDE